MGRDGRRPARAGRRRPVPLVPHAEQSRPVAWRKAWFYEYFREDNFAVPTVLAVRTEAAKLIRYPGHDEWTELFDLKADPHEKDNLADAPGRRTLRSEMEAEFDRQEVAVGFKTPAYADGPAP